MLYFDGDSHRRCMVMCGGRTFAVIVIEQHSEQLELLIWEACSDKLEM